MRRISIKLVALDLDGTLLTPDLQIAPRTREAIMAARANGVRFVIVTGRMYQSAAPYAKQLELDGLPMVTYNGALVQEYPPGRVIHHEPVPLETSRALSAFCEARGYHLHAYVNDELYVPNMNPETLKYLAVAQVKAHPVGSIFLWQQEPSTKLLIVADPKRIPQIAAEVVDLLGPTITALSSIPGFLEIFSSKVSKGSALRAVAVALGVDREQVMAVGDGMNDISMLSWAGTGVAMALAPEAVKKAADYVTQAAPGDGVREALERFVLSGQ